MQVEKNKDGSFTISDIVNDVYVHRKYMGFTLKEAKEMFTEHVSNLKENQKK